MTQVVHILPTITELAVLTVADAGVPNAERVYLRAAREVSLASYFLFTAWKVAEEVAMPLADSIWLGNMTVAADSWIVVYTGQGQQQVTKLENGDAALVLHWGKPFTLFNTPQIVPILIRADAIRVGKHFARKALA